MPNQTRNVHVVYHHNPCPRCGRLRAPEAGNLQLARNDTLVFLGCADCLVDLVEHALQCGDPYTVPCSNCGAACYAKCSRKYQGKVYDTPCYTRVDAARRASERNSS